MVDKTDDESNLRERSNTTEKSNETTNDKPPIPPPKTPKELYFEMLRLWVTQANLCQNAMAHFPYYLAANYPQLFQSNINSSTTIVQPQNGFTQQTQIVQPQLQPNQNVPQNRFNFFRNENFAGNQQQQHEEIINQNGGYEFVLAPLWKRFAAEVVDALLLFILKLMITFLVLEIFDLNLGIDFNFDTLKNSIEDDYILSITSDLIALEIITKFLVCIYEAVWTTKGYGIGTLGGATPGKILLGIRIIHINAIVQIDPAPANLQNNTPIRVLLFPISNPGFKRALIRAVAKNVLMALLFPLCFTTLFLRNNRTGYDILTKTVVVEENHAPIFRRR